LRAILAPKDGEVALGRQVVYRPIPRPVAATIIASTCPWRNRPPDWLPTIGNHDPSNAWGGFGGEFTLNKSFALSTSKTVRRISRRLAGGQTACTLRSVIHPGGPRKSVANLVRPRKNPSPRQVEFGDRPVQARPMHMGLAHSTRWSACHSPGVI